MGFRPAMPFVIRPRVYCNAAQAYFSAVQSDGGFVTDARKTIVNDLVIRLGALGLWEKFDRLWLLAAENSQGAGRDIKAAAAFASVNGGPTFTADRGYTGVNASTTVYIDTGVNVSTLGGNFTQNSAHVSCWIVNNAQSAAAGGFAMGANGASSVINLIPKLNDGSAYFRVNDSGAGGAGVAMTNSSGFLIASRTSSTQKDGYKNGVDAGEATTNSGALANANIYILARNVSGVANSGDDHQNAAVSIGSGFSSAESAAFYGVMLSYMQAVGVA